MPYINGNKVMGISNITISPSGPTGPTEIPSYCYIPYWDELGAKEVVLDLPSRTNFKKFMYRYGANTTVEHLTINGSQDGTITSMEQCFSGTSAGIDRTLKRLTLNCNLSNCENFYDMCSNMGVLEVIDGTPIDFSSATPASMMFSLCGSLKEFRVKPESIKISLPIAEVGYLSNETIQSIVDGLVDLTGQPKQKIIFGLAAGPNVTSAQKKAMEDKNWQVEIWD